MNIEQLRDYCLSKKGASEDFPFDNNTLVFKVMGKMFALIGLKKWEEGNKFINLKCDPEYAIEVREKFPDDITGAYHMSKTHWNSVTIDGSVSSGKIKHFIDHSYELVVGTLAKAKREELAEL